MSRVFLDLGFIQIYWYSVCVLSGILLAIYLILKESKKKGFSEDSMLDLLIRVVIWGVIGARLYYVAFNLDYYSKSPFEILEIWNGGLAIHGAILFGGLYLLYHSWKTKIDVLRLTDMFGVALIIGQAVGRWGNFFNQEAYGPAVSRTFLENLHLPKFIIEGMYIGGTYYQPTFLYEFGWNIVGFLILIIVRRFKYIKIGQLSGFYLMWYSLGRFYIESLRGDSLMFGTFRVAQVVSVVLFAIGFFLMVFRLRESKLDNLYNK